MEGFTLYCLCLLLAYPRGPRVERPLGRPPAVRGAPGEAKRGPEPLELANDVVLPSSAHLRPPWACVGLHRLPHPTRMHCAAPGAPHCVSLSGPSASSLPGRGAPALHFDGLGMPKLPELAVHWLERRCLLLRSFLPVCGLTCH